MMLYRYLRENFMDFLIERYEVSFCLLYLLTRLKAGLVVKWRNDD